MTNEAFITGDVRPSAEFKFTREACNMAQSTFTALIDGQLTREHWINLCIGLPLVIATLATFAPLILLA